MNVNRERQYLEQFGHLTEDQLLSMLDIIESIPASEKRHALELLTGSGEQNEYCG